MRQEESSEIRKVFWTFHDVHEDERGSLTEAAINQHVQHVTGESIAQVNVSISKAGVLRGMHAHIAQWDFWYIAQGVAEVKVSLPENFPRPVETRVLSPGRGVIIPAGVAHGFLAVTDLVLIYAVTNRYNQERPDELTYSAKDYVWRLPVEACIRSERDVSAGR